MFQGFTSSQPKVATKPKPLGDVKTVNFRPDPFKSDLCLHKNPLFSQESSTSELSLLQQRAETVGKNLSEIQAKLTKENSPDSMDRYNSTSLFPKGQLVVTVQAHLSQVQTALRSKLAQSTSDSNDSPPLRRFPQVRMVRECHQSMRLRNLPMERKIQQNVGFSKCTPE
jgi:hypothetical protein